MNVTITHNEQELDVEFSIQKAEPGNGIKEHIDEISYIIYKGIDVLELLSDRIEDIEKLIWAELKRIGED